MRRVRITTVAAAIAATTLATAVAAGPAQAASPRGARAHRRIKPSERTCAAAPAGYAACLARVVVNSNGTPKAKSKSQLDPDAIPAGYGPSDIQSAYNLSGASGAGRTVAIVDAYDDPTAEQDLATYRSTYGLPACTSSNGCFSKVDEFGGTSYPSVDAGWATEESLDLDMVSARPARAATSCSSRPIRHRSPTSARPSTPPLTSARLRSATATAAATAARPLTTTTPASRSPRRPVTAVTASSRRRASTPSSRSAAPACSRTAARAAGRSRRGAVRAAVARRSTRSRLGRPRQRSAAARPTPTSRPSPIRPPALPCTTRRRTRVSPAGRSTAAPARRRRSSPAFTRWAG